MDLKNNAGIVCNVRVDVCVCVCVMIGRRYNRFCALHVQYVIKYLHQSNEIKNSSKQFVDAGVNGIGNKLVQNDLTCSCWFRNGGVDGIGNKRNIVYLVERIDGNAIKPAIAIAAANGSLLACGL